MTNYCWISPVLTYASSWLGIPDPRVSCIYLLKCCFKSSGNCIASSRTYIYLFANRCHEWRGFGFPNKCTFIRALSRRRLESSSTEYEYVHISHYTLIRVLPPMDWWVYVHENKSSCEAIRSIFSYEYMIRTHTHTTFTKNRPNCSMFGIIFISNTVLWWRTSYYGANIVGPRIYDIVNVQLNRTPLHTIVS